MLATLRPLPSDPTPDSASRDAIVSRLAETVPAGGAASPAAHTATVQPPLTTAPTYNNVHSDVAPRPPVTSSYLSRITAEVMADAGLGHLADNSNNMTVTSALKAATAAAPPSSASNPDARKTGHTSRSRSSSVSSLAPTPHQVNSHIRVSRPGDAELSAANASTVRLVTTTSRPELAAASKTASPEPAEYHSSMNSSIAPSTAPNLPVVGGGYASVELREAISAKERAHEQIRSLLLTLQVSCKYSMSY
jgi:hypothetical protein